MEREQYVSLHLHLPIASSDKAYYLIIKFLTPQGPGLTNPIFQERLASLQWILSILTDYSYAVSFISSINN